MNMQKIFSCRALAEGQQRWRFLFSSAGIERGLDGFRIGLSRKRPVTFFGLPGINQANAN